MFSWFCELYTLLLISQILRNFLTQMLFLLILEKLYSQDFFTHISWVRVTITESISLSEKPHVWLQFYCLSVCNGTNSSFSDFHRSIISSLFVYIYPLAIIYEPNDFSLILSPFQHSSFYVRQSIHSFMRVLICWVFLFLILILPLFIYLIFLFIYSIYLVLLQMYIFFIIDFHYHTLQNEVFTEFNNVLIIIFIQSIT